MQHEDTETVKKRTPLVNLCLSSSSLPLGLQVTTRLIGWSRVRLANHSTVCCYQEAEDAMANAGYLFENSNDKL